jgi:acetylornithine/N-succinyldiaminopimelate aminotransferase
MGKCLRDGLERLKKRSPRVGELRGRGLLQGFVYDGEVKDLLARLQDNGLLVLRSGSNVVRLAPPLVISSGEIEKGIDIVEEALR